MGQDADEFFLELCKCPSLQIGSPLAISNPLGTVKRVIDEVSKSKVTNSVIQAEIDLAGKWTALLDAHYQTLQKQDIDPVSKIRETRLAGRHAEAYSLAKEALEHPTEEESKP